MGVRAILDPDDLVRNIGIIGGGTYMLILLAWTPVPKMSHQEGALMHYTAKAPKDRQQEAFP
jgi:hypothetical protein